MIENKKELYNYFLSEVVNKIIRENINIKNDKNYIVFSYKNKELTFSKEQFFSYCDELVNTNLVQEEIINKLYNKTIEFYNKWILFYQ